MKPRCANCRQRLYPDVQPTRPCAFIGAVAVLCSCGTWTAVDEEHAVTESWGLVALVERVEARL